jgi:hypothetical protein
MRDGSKQIDKSWQVWVGVDAATEPALRRWLGKIGRELGQEMMFLERSGGSIDLVPPLLPDGEADDEKQG